MPHDPLSLTVAGVSPRYIELASATPMWQDDAESTSTYMPLSKDALRLINPEVWSSGVAQDSPAIHRLSLTIETHDLTDQTEEPLSIPGNGPSDLRILQGQDDSRRMRRRFRWGDYVAMSHTWGDLRSTSQEEVSVNERGCSLSKNLAEGLVAISRLPGIKGGNLKIWNDVICLDQRNQAEMERELQKMSQIYAKACAVVAWVGPAADDSHHVMKLLQDFSIDHGPVMSSPEETLLSIKIETWKALAHFLLRPYWKRQWIVSELVLASDRTLLVCGNESAPLTSLWMLVRLIIANVPLCHKLFDRALETGGAYYDPFRHRVFSIIARLLYLYDIGQGLHRDALDLEIYDILPLIDVCRGSEQTYWRDKVYGILSILPTDIASGIRPDLDKPYFDVFSDLVLATIRGTKRLDVLQNCILDRSAPAFPTWTPDLSKKSMSHAFGSREIMKAGGRLIQEPTLRADGRLLVCKGVVIDTIANLTPSQWPLEPVSSEEAVEMVSSRPELSEHDPQHVRQALWHTLVGGSTGFPHSHRPPETYSQLLDLPWPSSQDSLEPEVNADAFIQHGWCSQDERQDMITFLMFRQRAGRDFDLFGHPLGSFFPKSEDLTFLTPPAGSTQVSEWSRRKMLRQACNTIKKRRVFVTQGGWVGVAGRQARQGDEVVVLRGCSTPLLLKRAPIGHVPQPGEERASVGRPEAAYMVVGACYLHGFIDGEAFSIEQYREREEEIVLM